MKNTTLKGSIVLTLLFLNFLNVQAQSNDDEDQNSKPVRKSKFLTGIFVGSYFANKYSANTYNGYGFDVYGNRNSFLTSFMNQKINNEYGGGYGQRDYIADAIGVDQHQWTFNESDMPFNMRYTPAIVVGVNFKLPLASRNFLILNMNGTKVGVEGNFTINTIKPNNPNPTLNNNVLNFPIKGREQRLFFQLGYQTLLGEDEKFNFLVEAGLMGTLVKFDQNYIYINELRIDLTAYVNQTANPAPYPTRTPVGFGIGGYGALGLNLDVSNKFNVQLLYSPTYEKINIGTNRKLKFQNSLGMRCYYKF